MGNVKTYFSIKESDIYTIGFFFLSIIFFNFFLISICFILRFTNTSFILLVSILISYFLALIKFSVSKVNYIVFFSVFLISIILIINGFFMDFSMDGMGYHKEIILELSKGWNPLYQKMEKEKDYKFVYNHYVKGVEFSQYSVYSLTKNIESSKVINFLFLFTALCFTYLSVRKIFIRKIFSILFTIFLLANPIVINQIFTFYVDHIVYLSFLICLSLLLLYTFDNKLPYINILLIMIVVLFVNIKTTSFALVVIIFLFYFIYLAYEKKIKKIKEISKLLTYSGILIGIISWYPFGENLLEKGNPIYPIIGKNKLDVIEYQRPPSLKEDLSLVAALKSVYYRVNNGQHSRIHEDVEEFKIPFFFKLYEIRYSSIASARLSGFGFWYSGFFTLAIILFIILCFYLQKKERRLFILFNLFIFCSIIPYIQGAWWARFVPQLWIFPVFVFFMGFYYGNKLLKNITKISICLVAIMILIIGGYNYSKTVYGSFQKRKCLSMLKDRFRDRIVAIRLDFESEEFYLNEYGIKYRNVSKKEYEKDKEKYYLFHKYYIIKK